MYDVEMLSYMHSVYIYVNNVINIIFSLFLPLTIYSALKMLFFLFICFYNKLFSFCLMCKHVHESRCCHAAASANPFLDNDLIAGFSNTYGYKV